MIDVHVGVLLGIWVLNEATSQLVAHPVTEEGDPVRPPLSLLDYLWYNPGVLRR